MNQGSDSDSSDDEDASKPAGARGTLAYEVKRIQHNVHEYLEDALTDDEPDNVAPQLDASIARKINPLARVLEPVQLKLGQLLLPIRSIERVFLWKDP